MKHSAIMLSGLVAVACTAGACRTVEVKVPVALDSSEMTADKGTRVKIPEIEPLVLVKGTPPDKKESRVAVFSASPSRHGSVSPHTFSLENAVMWSGRVPVTPAIGILDGRDKLSDIERIIRTADANKVDLILQIDEPRIDVEPLIPCGTDKLCIPSTLQVEDMKKLACTPVGSLPGLDVMSVEARVIRVKDAQVVAMVRAAMVAPSKKQVRKFDEPSVPNACRFEIFPIPNPYADYYDCCRTILAQSMGHLKPVDICPDLLECKQWKAEEAFNKRDALFKTHEKVESCKVPYTLEEVNADEKVPATVSEALWFLQQSAVHALLGGPNEPAALPPNVTVLPTTKAPEPAKHEAKPPPPPPPVEEAKPPAETPDKGKKPKDKAKDKPEKGGKK